MLGPISGELRVCLDDDRMIESLKKAIEPETKSQADLKRGKAHVKKISSPCNGIAVNIESQTSSGFKALFNAYVYLLETAIEVLEANSNTE